MDTRQKIIAIAVTTMLAAANAHSQSDTLAGAKYDVVDRFNVNVASGQVQIAQTTVTIGGDMGLRHTISSQTSDFVNYPLHGGGVPTVLGFGDSYRGGFYTVKLHGDGPDPSNWQYGIRIFGLGTNVDFALSSTGEFVPYTVPSSATLAFVDDSEFTGYVATTGNGTRLYYPGNQILTLDHTTTIRRRISKIVFPSGLTIEINIGFAIDGPIYSVRSNTGFQLKYDHTGSWTSSSPTKVTALNNKIERCPTDSSPCSPSSTWPYATYTWPVGEPDSADANSLRADSIFRVRDGAGRVTEYHHSVYESDLGDFAPRLVEIRKAGQTVMTYDYVSNLVEYSSSSNHSLILTAGIATVASASVPGGGGQGYSMHIPKMYWGTQIGNINGGGAGPGRINRVESENYGALSVIDTWDQQIDFYRTVTLNPTHDIVQVSNRVTTVRQKWGNTTVSFEYDDRGNVTQRTENGVTESAVYEATCTSSNYRYCNKPTWIEDGRGNRTHFTYHPESGQIKSKTAPADERGIHPKTLYQYDQYYAHYKKDSEVIQAADRPIWLVSSETYCQNSAMDSAGTCAGGDAVITTYEYDYNNLFVRGVAMTAGNTEGNIETQRACYEYDRYGNKIGETSPKANLASCL